MKHLLIVFWATFSILNAQVFRTTGAPSLALGNAVTALQSSAWQLFYNPAGLSGMNQGETVAYFERRYMLSELQYGAFGAVYPFHKNHLAGISVSSFGFELFRQSTAGLSYSATLFEKVSLGTKLGLLHTWVQNYGAATVFVMDIGGQVAIGKKINLGFRVQNVSQSRIEDQDIPTTIAIGTQYKISKKLLVLLEAEQIIGFPVAVKAGIQYAPVDYCTIRAGIGSFPVYFSAGIGFEWKKINLDIASQYHEILGFTPGLSVGWKFGKNKSDTVVKTETKTE